MGLAALIMTLSLALCGVVAIADQVRCVDAAREAARLTARGEPEKARAAAENIAPPGAKITIGEEGDHIQVAVQADPAGGLLPGLHVHAKAVAVREPDG